MRETQPQPQVESIDRRDGVHDRLAAEILAAEAWFTTLDPSMKDALSQPNHDHQQAERAVLLARAVQRSRPLRLTKAQREVLGLLADHGPMRTSKATHHDAIAGTVASALNRRGLVTAHGDGPTYRIQITEDGRHALEHEGAHIDGSSSSTDLKEKP